MKGQLNEAMSGMTTVFADALAGGDVKKFNENMKKGLYTEKDLAKVAAHMKTLVSSEQLANMLKAPDKVVQRMINAWGNLLMELNKAGFWDAMSSGIESVTEALTELAPKVKYAYGVISNLLKFVWENKEVLIPFAIGLRMVGSGIAIFTSAAAAGRVLSMAGAFRILGTSMVTAFLAPLAAISAVVLALDTYEAYTQHKKGLVADFRVNPEKEHKVGNEWAQNVIDRANDVQANPDSLNPLAKIQLATTIQKYVSVSGGQSAQEKHELVTKLREKISADVLNDDSIAPYLEKLDAPYRQRKQEEAESSSAFLKSGGLSPNQTINITVQNTEPNVTKDWLSSVLPSVLGNALQQHVQKEAAFTPNMLLR